MFLKPSGPSFPKPPQKEHLQQKTSKSGQTGLSLGSEHARPRSTFPVVGSNPRSHKSIFPVSRSRSHDTPRMLSESQSQRSRSRSPVYRSDSRSHRSRSRSQHTLCGSSDSLLQRSRSRSPVSRSDSRSHRSRYRSHHTQRVLSESQSQQTRSRSPVSRIDTRFRRSRSRSHHTPRVLSESQSQQSRSRSYGSRSASRSRRSRSRSQHHLCASSDSQLQRSRSRSHGSRSRSHSVHSSLEFEHARSRPRARSASSPRRPAHPMPLQDRRVPQQRQPRADNTFPLETGSKYNFELLENFVRRSIELEPSASCKQKKKLVLNNIELGLNLYTCI